MHSHTGQKEDILNHKTWFLGDERERARLVAGHPQGSKIVASLDNVTSREAAHGYVGKTIAIPASDLPKLQDDGAFYWREIEGLEAVTVSGARLGVVDRLFETGANDVLVIKQGNKEILVPYVAEVVRRVDLKNGIIEVDWETSV